MAGKLKISRDYKQAIDATVDLADCYGICMDTLNYALEKGFDYANSRVLKLLLDCADICQVTSTFMFPNSNPARRVAEICSLVSDNCADVCDEFKDDAQFQLCSKICRRAANSTRVVAGMEPTPA